MPNKAILAVLVAAAAGRSWPQGPARDMFYSAAGLVVPAKATAEKAKPTPKPKLARIEKAADRAPVSVVTGAPLGLRYSILKESAGGTVEVDADTVFRSGDRIRITIETNDRAHLYLVQRGSSGHWSVLFPTPEIAGGDNTIEKGRHYEVPAGHWFAFDEQAGKERLFVVLTRRPEADLEKMILALQKGEQGRVIDDTLVAKVRSQVLARDLVFEKVSENSTGGKKETAVYVVNQTGAADSRIVADITLEHR